MCGFALVGTPSARGPRGWVWVQRLREGAWEGKGAARTGGRGSHVVGNGRSVGGKLGGAPAVKGPTALPTRDDGPRGRLPGWGPRGREVMLG